MCVLIVSDDGVGLPDRIDIVGAVSLGLQLVHDLVEQLRGELIVERANGTRYVLTFKDGRDAESAS